MNENNFKNKILKTLKEATLPLDVEKIRVAAEISHWHVAFGHLMELLHEKKIHGLKTSKSWVFSTNPITD